VFYGSDYLNFNVPLSALEGTERQIRYEDGLKWLTGKEVTRDIRLGVSKSIMKNFKIVSNWTEFDLSLEYDSKA
jgi:hypothetical protein